MGAETSPMSFEANYANEYGVHNFRLSDDQTVTTVTGATWPRFMEGLRSLQGNEHGDIVLTPNIVTSADPCPEEEARELVATRIQEVCRFSESLPFSTSIILGSFTSGQEGHPTMSQLLISQGVVININEALVRTGDLQFTYKGELIEDTLNPNYIPTYLGGTALIAINKDLQFFSKTTAAKDSMYEYNTRYRAGDPVTDEVTTLLVSASWAVSSSLITDDVPARQRDVCYLKHIEKYASAILGLYPNLTDILIADRLPRGSNSVAPYTGHFKLDSILD